MIGAIPFGDISKLMDGEIAKGKAAVSRAMSIAGNGIKEDWRTQIRGAGLGDKLANTVRTSTYPKGGTSLNAASLVYTKAPKLLAAYDTGGIIKSKDGFWLAIPTEAAGKKGLGGKRITPGLWEKKTGMRLRMVYRRGKTALLVADGARLNKAGRAVMSKAKVGKSGIQRGSVTAVIFILVPQVTLRKRLDLAKPADIWAAKIPGLIKNGWKD